MKGFSISLKASAMVVFVCIAVSLHSFFIETFMDFYAMSRSTATGIVALGLVGMVISTIFKITAMFMVMDQPKRKRKNDELVDAVQRLSDQPFELETQLPADELRQSGASL
jgi:hypothetical protein